MAAGRPDERDARSDRPDRAERSERAGRTDRREQRTAPARGGDATGSVDPASRRTWSRGPADLTKEWELRDCATREFAGSRRPVIGRPAYPLLARIGHGGMGIVYFGYHPGFEIEVAVKVLPRHLVDRRPDLRRRFVREGRLAAELPSSDHLVRVFDVGRDPPSGLHFLVMEYVHGTSAAKWLASLDPSRRRGVTEELALEVCIAATRGVCVFHEHGAIHRDVKPDNILIPERAGELVCRAAKLSDLGLARQDAVEDRTQEMLTGENVTMMGTPGYAAPEQLHDPAGAKKPADVFSMGATLYALLTGRSPFERGSQIETLVANGKCDYVPIQAARPDVSPGTAAVIDLCLRLRPSERYPDAFALLDALLLCRSALGASGRGTADTTAELRRIALRTEMGDSVRTGPSFQSSDPEAGVRLEGGPPRAQVTLRRRGDPPVTYAISLDEEGRFTRDHVEPGVYDVFASLRGWHPFTGTVEIRAGECAAVEVAMREREARVSVDSDPAGAVVQLDGVPVGETPMSGLVVTPGSHTIALACRGHEPVSRTISVHGDEVKDLGRIALVRLGALDLTGFDADVSFSVEGLAVRGVLDLRPGEHRLAAAREGYEPQEVRVVVEPGGRAVPVLGAWCRQSWSLVSDLERWDATTEADRRRVARAIAQKLPAFELRAMETFESGGARHEVAVLVHARTGMEFSLVPGGAFPMGSDPDEPGRRPDERRHPVRVPPFLMARTPVTQAVFESVSGRNPSRFRGPGLPVEQVSWAEAADFCARLGLSLPSEAQWEYACRAGTATPWFPGDDPSGLDAAAWLATNAPDGPRPVGSRRANAFGLHDMHGNVWEWCADAYAEYEFEAESRSDLVAAGAGADGARYRVFRGGGWNDPPERLRSAQRAAFRPEYRNLDLGFRPVLVVTHDLFSAAGTPVPRSSPGGAAPSSRAGGAPERGKETR